MITWLKGGVVLGKGGATKSDEFSEKFQKGGGAGVFFNPKIHIPDFWNIKQGILSRKLIQKSNFKVQGMFFFQQLYWENQNKTQYTVPGLKSK